MEEMRSYLTSLREIESVTGIRYIKLHVTAKMIIGIREVSGKEFTINLDDPSVPTTSACASQVPK